MTVGAIILAAGMSRRMGSDKLSMPVAGKPMLRHVFDSAIAAKLPDPIVVFGHNPAAIEAVLHDCRYRAVTAKNYAEGLSQSLAAGVKAVPEEWRGVFVLLGDMPYISPALLPRMRALLRSGGIVVPVFRGQRGNPVLWSRTFLKSLAGLQGDSGGKQIFRNHPSAITELPWDDSILRDIDTPSSLRI